MLSTMPPSSVSVRRSICWLPGQKSEPTDTLVLTGGRTGVFVDIRFLKDSNELDWAFAGYRKSGQSLSRILDEVCSRAQLIATTSV